MDLREQEAQHEWQDAVLRTLEHIEALLEPKSQPNRRCSHDLPDPETLCMVGRSEPCRVYEPTKRHITWMSASQFRAGYEAGKAHAEALFAADMGQYRATVKNGYEKQMQAVVEALRITCQKHGPVDRTTMDRIFRDHGFTGAGM